jgi:hypothetical protein
MSRIKQCSVGTVSHGQVNVADDRVAVASIRRLRQSPQPCSAVNPLSDRSRGAKRVGRRAPREPLCWLSSARGQYTQGPIILSALICDVIYCDAADA